MVNFRIIARILSLVLIFEGLLMLLSSGISIILKDGSAASLLYSAIITIVSGIIAFTPLKPDEKVYGNREGYIIVTSTWIIFSLFGTLPFLFSGSIDNFTDAFFETMSGFTTTGATIIEEIESVPRGILLWRSLTQWIGGIGIIFISLSVLPIIRSVNIQLPATEFTGHPTDKIQPRFIESAKRLISIYILLTFIQTALLSIAGMPLFDAVCHSLSTLSTGGFSTSSSNIAAFATPGIKIILTFFMFIAGINLPIIYFALKGNFRKITLNSEVKFYVLLIIGFIILATAILILFGGKQPGKAISDSTFHIISIISTTGYYTADFNQWGNIMIMLLFILMFTGGTAGSTSGGIKIIRLLLVTKNYRKELQRVIHPNAMIHVRVDDHNVSQSNIYYLLVFTTLYFIVICTSAFIISLMGYDIVTSFSTAASMMANIGPSLGEFGPFSSYAEVPVAGKFFLSGLMLIGRLELLTFLILFSKSFYRH
ncbi:MAG TPA: TrkH family potassium uptake protein [Bacteroidales bacterium]|nr:TrkH family potassium uptake protein [Bacteroidales bacterium]